MNSTLHRLIGVAVLALLLTVSRAWTQDMFVSDFINGNIYRITPSGKATIFASDMDYPYGIAFNRKGDLFVANSALDAGTEGYISKIDPDGTPNTFYSNIDPKSVAVNSAGDVFEADYHSGIIYKYTPGGKQSVFASGFWAPLTLAFDSEDDLYVGDGYGNGNGRVTEIMPNKTQRRIAKGLSYPSFAINKAGDVFVSNQGNGYIYEYRPKSSGRRLFAVVGGVNGDNNNMAFNSAGDLFVCNAQGPIVEITPEGYQHTFATIPGNPAGIAFEPAPSFFFVRSHLLQRHF